MAAKGRQRMRFRPACLEISIHGLTLLYCTDKHAEMNEMNWCGTMIRGYQVLEDRNHEEQRNTGTDCGFVSAS